MKMNTKYLHYILCSLIILGATSCKKWLDVQPEDKFTQEQMYRTPTGVAELMNGFYITLGDTALYGKNLTLTTLDVFAQRYLAIADKHPYYFHAALKYEEKIVKNNLSNIWSSMYANIANVNDFVRILPNVENGMTQLQKDQYIGEAIGLRALMHFDLLRMFGNYYDETTKMQSAIPYYRQLSTTIEPFLTNEQVVQHILEDIVIAEKLLAKDPIFNQLSTDNFNNNRFNYYAVKALEARVYQWIGNREKALKAAQEVIAAQQHFPWVTHEAITANGGDPDRKFFSEQIFSVFNAKLNEVQRDNFDSNLLEDKLLATGPKNFIETIYDNYTADYRYIYSWPRANVGVQYRTFVKYADISSAKILSRSMVPVIRISEMYYIAAESTNDQAQAIGYLNTVTRHRNILSELTDYSLLRTALTKEYEKEFFGEGQLWYYYKRNKITSVNTPSTTDNKTTIELYKYQFPIPEEELNGR